MIIPVSPDVLVYEPEQKAIVAWNGSVEVLVLSTDVNGEAGTSALEIMPLPSNPTAVEQASFEWFETVQSLIWENAPANENEFYGERGETVPLVVVTFHEKIGAHDITVVNANDTSKLTIWTAGFLASNEVAGNLSMEKFTPIFADYLKDGFNYFVFDLIEVSQQENSLQPILYKFETSFLHYPLRISSLNPGNTKITLFLLTEDIVDQLFCYPFSIAQYRSQYSPQTLSPVQFNMTLDQVNRISPEIAKLFKGGAWLTALEYEGSMSALTNDFIIHAWAFPLSHIIRATNVTLILGFLGAGMAMVAYASFGILMKRKSVVPLKVRS
jgi:hypothetical protein